MNKRHKLFVCLGAALVLSLGLFFAACTPQSQSGSSTSSTSSTPAVEIPDPNENGVITAAQWKDIYPDIYDSFQMNAANTARESYLDMDPFLRTIYDGTGFAKAYDTAIGHPYTLTDVFNTARPHALANCLTCKTPELTTLVNTEGIGIYSTPFEEVYARVSEPISCYSCHANTAGELVPTSQFLLNSLGADASKVALQDQVCGQCHNEYYFDPETKEVKLPWRGLAAMTPDAILQYYNDMGFKDFTNSISGADMIKVQHPEIETVLGAGSKVPQMGFTCADCHMGTTTDSNGEDMTSHNLISPLRNRELIESTCSSCHADIASEVAAIQKTVVAREREIGEKLARLTTMIGDAAANGTKTEEELAALRLQLRNAQFYWDFCYVENSEGAHNSALAKYLLDKAESIVDEALATF